MKKKLTAIFLCVALVAIAVVGASLAYFTDTDRTPPIRSLWEMSRSI